MKKIICSPDAPAAIGPYSQAVECNGTLYISGQLGINPANGSMPETLEEQTICSLKNLGAILKEAGMDYGNVVKTTVLLSDIADFGVVNGIYSQYFTQDFPARACYQVAALPKGGKIEIEAIACR